MRASWWVFDRNERFALVVLLLVCASASILIRQAANKPPQIGLDAAMLDTLILSLKPVEANQTHRPLSPVTLRLPVGQFNPDTASLNFLMAIGLPGNLARGWVNYRSKMDRPFRSSDVQRLYGMTTELWEQLEPLLDDLAESPPPPSQSQHQALRHRWRPKPAWQEVNVNKADTGDWIQLRGIGPVLAKRIVAYRDRLGGFYSLEQLQEVYGLDSTVIQANGKLLRVDTLEVSRLLLDTVSYRTLLRHPYIERPLAEHIMALRRQGAVNIRAEVAASWLMTEAQWSCLRYYLK